MSARQIELRGVEVHNLKKVDLDLAHRQLIVFCGVSGSGKTSLALDTLYAEGQRRYIESFSAYTRQFLERLEKPAARRIDGIPPAIAVTRKSASRSNRATVGTATETLEYLKLLWAKIGHVVCQCCHGVVHRDTPQSAAARMAELPSRTRFMITFAVPIDSSEQLPHELAALREDGFGRVLLENRIVDLRAVSEPSEQVPDVKEIHVVVDRLTAGNVTPERLRDSFEMAFAKGQQRCRALVAPPPDQNEGSHDSNCPEIEVDGARWLVWGFSQALLCDICDLEYPEPEPKLFSFNSPLGACPECEGFGNVVEIDMDAVIPNREQTIRDGAIAPWNTPAYRHELEELLALAADYNIPVDKPIRELNDEQLRLIREGVPERDFGGLDGFFRWLERRKYKMHLRVFLSRWRSYRTCPSCDGARLRPEALATRIGGHSIAAVCQLQIDDAVTFFQSLSLTDHEHKIGRVMLEQVRARLGYLQSVGLGYLSLDRTLRTLSGGEAQRVALTSALGSSLVNMLYVLDEPSVGLHPRDVDQLSTSITGLRDRGNTVIVVEHEPSLLRIADQLVEVGPGAGDRGGEIVFQGTLSEMELDEASLTGDYLIGRRGTMTPQKRRATNRGWIRLHGARGNNLQNLDVSFPLGCLCIVTGVSGSGKSTLVQETLYPALCRRKRKESVKPLPHDELVGDGQIDDVLLVDQSPIGRSPRSNPVTYVKAFDEIRNVFADTLEARTHNYAPGRFSFNVDGGRCDKCKGEGHIAIDMQFLADVYMRCDQCGGTRYRREILEVTYRGRNIADVLEMTVREAFLFFRGQQKVQHKLKRLIDVGLDYLRLGQPANTLSAGEAQRLKLAAYMSAARRHRTLFLLDEPTTGLHFSDVVQLMDCFDALLNVGHSLVVVEHNLQLMKAADYLIDLGPGAANAGGRIVVCGSPEEVAQCDESATGRFLKNELADVMEPVTDRVPGS